MSNFAAGSAMSAVLIVPCLVAYLVNACWVGSRSYVTVSAGALPNGLSLNAATGAITGTPTVANTFNFTITATDTVGATGSTAYSVTINPVADSDPHPRQRG